MVLKLWLEYTFITLIRKANNFAMFMYTVKRVRPPKMLLYIDQQSKDDLAELERKLYERINQRKFPQMKPPVMDIKRLGKALRNGHGEHGQNVMPVVFPSKAHLDAYQSLGYGRQPSRFTLISSRIMSILDRCRHLFRLS